MKAWRKQERDLIRDRAALVRRFYPVEDGCVQLRFAQSEELFQTALSGGEVPRLKAEVIAAIDSAVIGFKHEPGLRLSLEPPADSGYDPEAFHTIVRENLRLHLWELMAEYQKNRRYCLWLFGGGLLLLALSYLCSRLVDSDILFDVVNILGSLLIWTAGETYFLDQAENRLLRRKYAQWIEKGNESSFERKG